MTNFWMRLHRLAFVVLEERQQLGDLVQAQTELLSSVHETQKLEVIVPAGAVAGGGPLGNGFALSRVV